MPDEQAEQLAGQECPVCHKKTLTLTEQEKEVPFFGRVYLFSMSCENCRYHKADIEAAEQREPCKYTIEISSEEDMKIRVVKSSQATIKIPRITTITPGPASNGFITNIEGIFNRIKNQVEFVRDNAEDADERKKAKNMLKKIMNIMWGREKIKMTI
jgi:zinc finger protein